MISTVLFWLLFAFPVSANDKTLWNSMLMFGCLSPSKLSNGPCETEAAAFVDSCLDVVPNTSTSLSFCFFCDDADVCLAATFDVFCAALQWAGASVQGPVVPGGQSVVGTKISGIGIKKKKKIPLNSKRDVPHFINGWKCKMNRKKLKWKMKWKSQ